MSDVWTAPTGPQGALPAGSAATFGDVTRNASLIASRGGARLLMAYAVVAVAMILIQAPGWFLQLATSWDPANTVLVLGGALGTLVWSFVQIVLMMVVSAFSAGLARVARSLLVEPEAVGGLGAILGTAASRLLPVLGMLLVTSTIIGAGTCFFLLPGLAAAFFLSSTVYLVAATDTEFGSAFERSYRMALNNAPLLLAMFAVILVVTLALGGFGFAIGFGATLALGPVGQMLGAALGAVVGAVVGYPLFLVSNAFLTAIETADSGAAVVE